MSRSPICHCQVSPTVGCHHDCELGEDVEGKEISFVGEAGKGGDEAFSSLGVASQADNAIARIKPVMMKFLNHMMFELWQIVFMLCEQFIRHLADLGEGQDS